MSCEATVLKVMSGLLTPTVAIVGAYIAWRQHKNAQDKLRLDLFDRRFQVYRGVMDLLASIARDGNISDQDLPNYYKETDQHRFLFKQDLQDYLKEMRQKAIRLRQLNRLIDPDANVPDEKRDPAIEEEGQLLAWFTDQIDGEVAKRFTPYLGFYLKY
jgi:hypothetical protein